MECCNFQAAAERHLTGLCEWSKPDGGMFMWYVKVHLDIFISAMPLDLAPSIGPGWENRNFNFDSKKWE